MHTAPVISTGPVDEVRRAHDAALEALRKAVARGAELWRQVDDPNAPVPGLTWTAAETAAHVVGDMRDYAQRLTRYVKGYVTHAERPVESPSRLSAMVNARHLTEVPDRDMHRLANMLEGAASTYLAAAASVDVDAKIPVPNGLSISAPTMTCLLLCEQLMHGLDISRAARKPWSIDREDALLVIPAVLSIAPKYLHRSVSQRLRVSYELRMRGGNRYRLSVQDGVATVTAAGAKSDCTITADPVAFLLIGYGRAPQLPQIIRGRLRAGGRKPWLAAKFGTILSRP
jgi:Mycothiol maleylpyruvate isomerase N-terminal domain